MNISMPLLAGRFDCAFQQHRLYVVCQHLLLSESQIVTEDEAANVHDLGPRPLSVSLIGSAMMTPDT